MRKSICALVFWLALPVVSQAANITFDVNEIFSAITSVVPDDPLDGAVEADFDFDLLKFSGGSVISAADPITFNGAINQTTTIAPSVDASVNATSTVTYSNISFGIENGSTQNGASPSDQSWSVSSDVVVQASGTISVTGFGNVNFTVDTLKTVTASGASLSNAADTVSLEADVGGTDITIPFETNLPLNIEASDVTLSGSLLGLESSVKNMIASQINSGSPSVDGTVIAHSSDSLDIPKQVSFEVIQNQSILNISTAGGLSASSNLQGTLEGLRNTTAVRIDSSSGQQVNGNVVVNSPTTVLGSSTGVTASATVNTVSIMMEYGLVSEIIQDGASPALVDLAVDKFEILLNGDIELDSLLGDDTGTYALTGTIDPLFLLSLDGADPILLYTDAQYEYLSIPFDVLVDQDSLLNMMTFDVEVSGIALLSSGVIGDLLLNSFLTTSFLSNHFTDFSLQGEVLARRSLSSVPLPATVWLFGSGLIGLVGMARRKKA